MSLSTSNTDTDPTTSSTSTRTMTDIHGQPQNYMYIIRPAQLDDLPYLASIEKSAASAFITSSDPDLAPLADDEPMDSAVMRECAESWSHINTLSRGNADANEDGLRGTWVAVAEPNATSKHSMDSEMKGGKVVGFIVTSLLPVISDETKRQCKGSLGGGKREGFIHIHEVSVHVEHQRRGLAKKLIGAVKECAAEINRRSGMREDEDEDEEGHDMEEKKREVEVLGLSLTTFRDIAFNAPFYRKLGFEEVEVDMMEEMVGREGMTIWEEEKHRFLGIGDGKLAARRCWMICKCGR